MKVKELIELLETVDPEKRVLIGESRYAYTISENVREREIRAAFGKDYNAVIIRAEDQVGGY